MIPLILGLVSAATFLGLSISVYGVDVLAQSAWVAMVFWGLVGSGLAVSLLGSGPLWLARLKELALMTDGACRGAAFCR